MKRFVITLVLLALAFLAGYGPMYLKNLALQDELTQSRSRYESDLAGLESDAKAREATFGRRLRLASLHRSLGLMLIQLEAQNFQTAREQSTKFFDALADVVFEARDEDLSTRLKNISAWRDEVTAGLASMDPAAVEKVRMLYVELADVLSGA